MSVIASPHFHDIFLTSPGIVEHIIVVSAFYVHMNCSNLQEFYQIVIQIAGCLLLHAQPMDQYH